MFGVSFTELMLIGMVALIVVGPQRLPGMMANVGRWSSKLRRMLFDVRQQSGIDDILRAEGITGGLNEIRALRNAVRGNVSSLTQALTAGPRPSTPTAAASTPGAAAAPPIAQTALAAESDPYANVPYDRTREYPDEGCDAYGAIADDLWAASHRPPTPAAAAQEQLGMQDAAAQAAEAAAGADATPPVAAETATTTDASTDDVLPKGAPPPEELPTSSPVDAAPEAAAELPVDAAPEAAAQSPEAPVEPLEESHRHPPR